MEIKSSLIFLLVLIVGIWLFIELKRLRHKIFAILAIGLLIFTYISFTSVISDAGIDLKTFKGLKDSGVVYFSWLGSTFSNIKTITANAIHMNWDSEDSEQNT